VATYQLLFSEIKQQPKPAFDFDLRALVLPQLPSSTPRLSTDRFVAGFLVVFLCGCVGIPVYIFRQNFLYLFSGLSTFFIWAILCSALLILLFKALNMYKKYQKQMHFLNFN
jgi:dolichol kinase